MPQRLGISTMSLGRAWVHAMETKLEQAAQHGYAGVEIYYEDLEYHAKTFPGGATPENQILAAKDIRRMCESRNLVIINLQPFLHYDGLKDRNQHTEKIKELKRWFTLAKELGTDMIAVPATFLPADQLVGDHKTIISDLQELSDLGAAQQPPIRFCYEALAWSTHIETWELSWEIVSKVDRPNLGLCLDTFNLSGRVYADPARDSGKTETADADTAASIARLGKLVDPKKLFFVQVVDAERLSSPLVEGHEFYDADQPARMSWSRNCRLFYGETDRGAYLPVREVLSAILNDIGYEGWLSFELFNRSMSNPSPDTPEQHAYRGAVAWRKMVEDFGFEDAEDSAVSVDSLGTKDAGATSQSAGVASAL